MSKHIFNFLSVGLLLVTFTTQAFADVYDYTPRDVMGVGVYQDGSIVLRFSPAVSAGCQYNDTTYTLSTSPAYKLISVLALTAYTSHRQVNLVYDGCNSGNVNLTGLILPE